MLDLGFWTTLVNLFSLAAAEWLGFYIVTRSPRSLLSWLTALALWALGAYFFYTALAVNETVGRGSAWTQQVVIIVAPLWFHISVLLAQPCGVSHRTRWQTFNRIAVPCMYLYTTSLIAIGLLSRLVVIPVSTNSVDYRNAPGPLYPLVILLFFLCLVPSVLNLLYARNITHDPDLRTRYTLLILATALTVCGGLYLATNLLLGTGLPAIIGDLFLAAGVLLLGFAVARFSAFLEGRSMNRDFLYTLLVVGSLTIFYALIVFVLYLGERLSFLALALTIVGMVAANSLFDGVRLTLDRIFYAGRFRDLRANLRALSREAGASSGLNQRLHDVLVTMCNALDISGGFIAVRRGENYVVCASQDALPLEHLVGREVLDAKEMMGLTLPSRKGLQGMALLIPLLAGSEQIGAVVLGMREHGTPYEEHDLELLEDLADQIARLLHEIETQQTHAQALNAQVVEYRERERSLELQVQQLLAESKNASSGLQVAGWDESQFIGQVEDGLRHIHDYPYLGEHALTSLQCMQRSFRNRAAGTTPTLLDRGKAVSEQLLALLENLKPNAPAPKANQVPPREWHLYFILYDSYVLEETNREVMSKLYISEGTFSRTRRRAIHAMAKALAEVESQN
jgi:hypothetical protein